MAEPMLGREELRAEVASVLARESAVAAVRSATDAGRSLKTPLWPLFARLGWLGLIVPEAQGGLEQGFAQLSAVYRELGRHLTPVPFLETMAVADALVFAGTAAQRDDVLPRLAAGELSAILQTPEAAPTVAASMAGGAIRLQGKARFFLGTPDAELALVQVAFEDGDTGYVFVALPAAGLARVALPVWDRTRSLLDVDCADVAVPAANLLCKGDAAKRLTARLTAHVGLALACDAVGGAAGILAATLEYMALRRQFGRPIASFQALKHRCADHKARLEGAGAFVEATCDAFAAEDTGRLERASIAKHHACAVYKEIAEDAIQLHGGIGFTWEHPCHLYLKRARLNEMFGGTANWHRDAIAAELMQTGTVG